MSDFVHFHVDMTVSSDDNMRTVTQPPELKTGLAASDVVQSRAPISNFTRIQAEAHTISQLKYRQIAAHLRFPHITGSIMSPLTRLQAKNNRF